MIISSTLSRKVCNTFGVRLVTLPTLKCVLSGIVFSCMAASAAAQSQPFLDICVNVSNAVALVEDKMAEMDAEYPGAGDAAADEGAASELSFKVTLNIIKALQIGKVHLFVYPDKQYKTVPVLIINDISRKALDPLLAENGILSQFLVMEKEGVYKFKEQPKPELSELEALDEAQAEEAGEVGEVGEVPETMPMDNYRLWLNKKGAIIAPILLSQAWTNAKAHPASSPVAKLEPSTTNDTLLLSFSVIMPQTATTNWADEVAENPMLSLSMVPEQISMGILEQITEPLRQTKALSFSLGLKKDKARSVRFVQWFRTPGEAAKAHAKLKGDGVDEEGGVLSALVGVTKDKAVKSNLVLQKDNSVLVSATWSKTNDEAVVAPLIGAVMTMMFSGGDGALTFSASSSDEPLATEYIPTPVFNDSLDSAALQGILKKEVLSKLFPQRYWDNGDEPSMGVECDYLEFPNGLLSEITYDVIAATAPDGSSILRKTTDHQNKLWNNSEGFSSGISIPIMKGTKEELLDKATARLTFLMPTQFVVFDVTTNDIGKKLEQKGCAVTVKSIAGGSVSVNYTGGESAKMFACDATGQFLKNSSSSWSGKSMSAYFHGVPVAAKVLVIQKNEPIQVDVPVALNKGKGIDFPQDPSDAVPNRCAYEKTKQNKGYSDAQLAAWKVAWQQEQGGREFTGTLKIPIDEPSFEGSYDWTVFYFGKDKPLYLDGNGGWSGGGKGSEISYYPHDGDKVKICAAYGYADITVPGSISTLTFDKTAGTAAVVRATSSGTNVSVSFQKNHIVVGLPRNLIVEIQAINAEGKPLREYGSSEDDGVVRFKYWGQPKKVVLNVADKQIKRRIPVDLTREGIDLKAYESFKKNLALAVEAAKTLQEVGKAVDMKMWIYDDTVAGAYYLFDRSGEQVKCIDVAIANSDPAGQARYGYEVKPYKGYYFTTAKGQEANDGKQNPYKRTGTKEDLKWEKGSFAFDMLNDRPDLIAIPVDKNAATIIRSWSSCRCRFLDGATLEYVPEAAFPKGWLDIGDLSLP